MMNGKQMLLPEMEPSRRRIREILWRWWQAFTVPSRAVHRWVEQMREHRRMKKERLAAAKKMLEGATDLPFRVQETEVQPEQSVREPSAGGGGQVPLSGAGSSSDGEKPTPGPKRWKTALKIVLLVFGLLFFFWGLSRVLTPVELVVWGVLVFVLLAVAIYLDANLGAHFTFLGETDIAFVMKGNELHKVLIGLSKEDSQTIKKKLHDRGIPWSDRGSSLLAKWFGIHYVHFLYPLFRLHEFEILAESIKDGSQGRELPEEGALMREWIYRQKRKVKALRWKFPHPFVFEEVELPDRTTVDIIVMTFLEVEDTYPPVFTYRGNFFEATAPFVSSATIDVVVGDSGREMASAAELEGRDLRYSNFVRIDKGEDSDFSNRLQAVINKVIPNVLGIKAEKAYVFNFGLSKGQQEAEAASREEAIQRMRASGTIEKAKGDAEARRINAEAEALRLRLMAEPILAGGADPNVTAEFLRAVAKYENIKDSKLTTWVDAEGGLGPVLERIARRGGQT